MLARRSWGKMEFIKDFCWVTDMCRRDIWMLRRVKKHDRRGVSLHDLFLTSCCVKAPWLCNLPCGLKQCRLDFFFLLPLMNCHCAELVFASPPCESSPDLVFLLVGRARPASGHMAWSRPHLPLSACWSRWRLSVTPSTPWRTRKERGGMRRVAMGEAAGAERTLATTSADQ